MSGGWVAEAPPYRTENRSEAIASRKQCGQHPLRGPTRNESSKSDLGQRRLLAAMLEARSTDVAEAMVGGVPGATSRTAPQELPAVPAIACVRTVIEAARFAFHDVWNNHGRSLH